MSNTQATLQKWHKTKKTLEILEAKIAKYKAQIAKEMNEKNTDKISSGEFTVSRRRNTRSYVTKDSLPADLWKEYATKCHYDAFFLAKIK